MAVRAINASMSASYHILSAPAAPAPRATHNIAVNPITSGGKQWYEFLGENAGLVVAELELDDADAVYERPDWLGEEVPGVKELAPVLEDQTTVHHACEVETSLMMVLAPGTVKHERLPEAFGAMGNSKRPSGWYLVPTRFRSFKEVTPSGVLGDARRASRDKGEKVLALLRETREEVRAARAAMSRSTRCASLSRSRPRTLRSASPPCGANRIAK